MRKKKSEVEQVRFERKQLCEHSMLEFCNLLQPDRYFGNIHREVISWITASNASRHQLLLLPRDHMKSAIAGLYAAWLVTRNPAIRILYISSTSNLATKQLKFIKDILTSPTYRLYWPEMVNLEEAKREKWTEREISVDHPKRREEYIRDPTIFTAGLTTNIVGMHADIKILDDVVVHNNAYLEDMRRKVLDQYGYLSSVGSTEDRELVVGTRYHPNDLYASLLDRTVDDFDEDGSKIGSTQLFDHREWPVETAGDGTGVFIWPKSKAPNGQWYGFDSKILAVKRASYENRVHFRAQYYNDPQDMDNSPIKRDLFQYYDSNYLSRKNYAWNFKHERLNVVAAIDFAFTTGKNSDSTSIVVVGADGNNNYYVLDIERFKTDKISEYFARILKLYEKWGFRKIRCEVSVAQSVIVKDLKDNYIRPLGLSLTIDEFRPSRWQGSKEERIMTILEPKYANGQVWHCQSGNIQVLEEELLFTNPPHDDVKDALASAIDFAVAPLNIFAMKRNLEQPMAYHKRFGGVQ